MNPPLKNCPKCKGTGEIWIANFGDPSLGYHGPYYCECMNKPATKYAETRDEDWELYKK